MNEITRIHIAKTAYDIEVNAKKQLQKYLQSLQMYTQDPEVLADIEIRITELLAEHGVDAGAVIDSKDIDAVRAQLGEPHDFVDDSGDIATGITEASTKHRYYRSLDDAVLGGVLGGAAAYVGVNPLWTRLAFTVVLFMSFGVASLAYVLVWIFTPAARTATEKLQLIGKEVTVESIKALSISEATASPRKIAPVVQRTLGVTLGVASLLGALAALSGAMYLIAAVVTSSPTVTWAMTAFGGQKLVAPGIFWTVWLLVIAGLLLLAALCSLIAYAFFARKLTKRMVASGIVITVLGCVSATSVVIVSLVYPWQIASETRSMIRETKVDLPIGFTSVTAVSFGTDDQKDGERQHYFDTNIRVRYVVDEGTPRYELKALPGTKIAVTLDGATAKIDVSVAENLRNSFVQPELTIYGPALSTIKVGALELEYSGSTQDKIAIDTQANALVSITGTYGAVSVTGIGSVSADESTVGALSVDSGLGLVVTAGTVQLLSVTQPEVCPTSTYGTTVHVVGVTLGSMNYNGHDQVARTRLDTCSRVIIGRDNEDAMDKQ